MSGTQENLDESGEMQRKARDYDMRMTIVLDVSCGDRGGRSRDPGLARESSSMSGMQETMDT